MAQKRPLLSICIPTYNRAAYLKQALQALVDNEEFDSDIEVVISDNNSKDETEIISKFFSEHYDNIKYFKNDSNVADSNFALALDRSTGEYAKLMNDNHVILKDGLRFLKETIRKYHKEKPAIFFTGPILFNHEKVDECILRSFEDFVVHLSYYVTAIYCFGVWREDWDDIKDKTKYTSLKLNQDDWSYQIMEKKGRGILKIGEYAVTLPLDQKQRKGYNWFEVHIANYYTILQPYIDKGLVSANGISLEKKTYLKGIKMQMVQHYIFNPYPEWNFEMNGAGKILWKYFKKEPYFYLYMASFPIWGFLVLFKFYLKNNVVSKKNGKG